MSDTEALIQGAYAAFNGRDIDAALVLMDEDVSWPKASEGGSVTGKEKIREYWTRQWAQFDPHVEPLAMTGEGSDTVRVRVHQVVRSLHGEILSDSEVLHVFTLRSALITAMRIGDTEHPDAASSAFAHRS